MHWMLCVLLWGTAVYGFYGGTGVLRLLVGAAPVNDMYANRTAIYTGVNVTGSTLGATKEPAERDVTINMSSTIWYAWVAPADGNYIVSTAGSSFSAAVGVYRAAATLSSAGPVRVECGMGCLVSELAWSSTCVSACARLATGGLQ